MTSDGKRKKKRRIETVYRVNKKQQQNVAYEIGSGYLSESLGTSLLQGYDWATDVHNTTYIAKLEMTNK